MPELVRDLAALHQFNIETARAAGSLIKTMRESQTLEHKLKAQDELVTSADIAADELIISRIQANYPSHRILSEETYKDKTLANDLDEPIWIIDPIDGTVNYAHGQNMVAVSIAFAQGGRVVSGVVYNPFLEELFEAQEDQPAILNGETIKPSALEDLRRGVIATGFPYNKSTVPEIIERVQIMLLNCQDIRRLGSAAMDICWVACGRLDGYFESLSPWDFAAARLIAKNAGATCGHFTPVPDGQLAEMYCHNLLIATPGIYTAMDKLLE